MDIEFALKEYGLSGKEIEVYLALLPLGSINLQEIGKRVNLPRTTIYNTLNYLSQRGLVSKIVKKGVTFFEAAEPKKILEHLKQREELIENVLPQLSGLKKNQINTSSVEIYEGSKGLFTVLSDIFKKKQEVCYFGSYSLSVEVLKHQPDHFRNIRLEKQIPAKIVIDRYDEDIFHTKKYKKITKMRFLKSLEDFPAMI